MATSRAPRLRVALLPLIASALLCGPFVASAGGVKVQVLGFVNNLHDCPAGPRTCDLYTVLTNHRAKVKICPRHRHCHRGKPNKQGAKVLYSAGYNTHTGRRKTTYIVCRRHRPRHCRKIRAKPPKVFSRLSGPGRVSQLAPVR